MKNKYFTIVLLLTGMLLAACGPSRVGYTLAEVTGPQAWFDAPLPNTVCYPPSPCQVVVHGSDPGGLTQFEFVVNGKVESTIPSPDTQDSLVTLSHDWTPPGPGTYALQIRAQNKGGKWSNFASTTVVVGSQEATTPVATASPTATMTPTLPSGASISIIGVSSNLVYYRGSCSPKDLTVQVNAVDPAGIKVVVLFYRVKSSDGSKMTDFNSKSMNPQGGGVYMTTVNPESEFGGGTLAGFGDGVLELQAVIQTTSGDTSTRTTVLSAATVTSCGGGGSSSGIPTLMIPPHITIITPTPVIIR